MCPQASTSARERTTGRRQRNARRERVLSASVRALVRAGAVQRTARGRARARACVYSLSPSLLSNSPVTGSAIMTRQRARCVVATSIKIEIPISKLQHFGVSLRASSLALLLRRVRPQAGKQAAGARGLRALQGAVRGAAATAPAGLRGGRSHGEPLLVQRPLRRMRRVCGGGAWPPTRVAATPVPCWGAVPYGPLIAHTRCLLRPRAPQFCWALSAVFLIGPTAIILGLLLMARARGAGAALMQRCRGFCASRCSTPAPAPPARCCATHTRLTRLRAGRRNWEPARRQGEAV